MHKKTAVIGIWGAGITGKAAVRFFGERDYHICVMDNRAFTPKENALFAQFNVTIYAQDAQEQFFAACDYIIPSAGIDIRQLIARYHDKLLFELDIFAQHAQLPILAITGTVGKTTLTTLLAHILAHYNRRILTGGNIGIPTLDLIQAQKNHDIFVLETADVQLKYCRTFAPDYALFANFSPNHLSWHDSLDDYFAAKCTLIAQQRADQHALIPFDLYEQVSRCAKPRSIVHTFSCTDEQIAPSHPLFARDGMHFFYDGISFCVQKKSHVTALIGLNQLPAITFTENLLIIAAALHIMQYPFLDLPRAVRNVAIPPHRLETIATVRGVTYINDSKATTISATRAALGACANKAIILILGGLDKGVDRTEFVATLPANIKLLICFGAQAESLAAAAHVPAMVCATLRDVIALCKQTALPHDIVLFSPAGSSFDLYTNYQERGEEFRSLVHALQTVDHGMQNTLC